MGMIIISSPLRYGRYQTTGDPAGTPPVTYYGKSYATGTILYVTARMAKRYLVTGKLTFVDDGPQQSGDVLIKGGRRYSSRHRDWD